MAYQQSQNYVQPTNTDCDTGWSHLPPLLVEKIVRILKNDRYWGSAGRALRSLNKHWCECVDLNITVANPAFHRSITKADVHSLCKFPNLEAVNISQFIIADNKFGCGMLFRERWWRKLGRAEQKRRLVDLLTVLTKARNVTTIWFDGYLQMIKKSLWMDNDVLNLLREIPVKSILGNGFDIDKPHYLEDVILSTGWSLEEVLDPRVCIYNLLKWPISQSLKRLDIAGHRLFYTPEVHQQIMSLDKSCTKCLLVSMDHRLVSMDLISELENVEALNLEFISYVNLIPLSRIKSLRHISIYLDDDQVEILEHDDLVLFGQRWTREMCTVAREVKPISLRLSLWSKPELNDQELINGFSSVKCLRLSTCLIESTDVLKFFTNLDFLDLNFAFWDIRKDIWNHLNGLSSTQRRVLDNLRWLRLQHQAYPRKVAFRSVQKLRNLEVLSIHQHTFRNIQSLNLLNELTNLRELEIRFERLPISLWCLPNLKILKHLDVLRICDVNYTPELVDVMEAIERKFPELEVTVDFYCFNDAYKEYI